MKTCRDCPKEIEKHRHICDECRQQKIDERAAARIRQNPTCRECGTKINSMKRLCDKCREDAIIAQGKKVVELRHKFGVTRRKDVNCVVCGDLIKDSYQYTKPKCGICRKLIAVDKAKKNYDKISKQWNELDEEERLRRMKLVTDKLLTEENESEDINKKEGKHGK